MAAFTMSKVAAAQEKSQKVAKSGVRATTFAIAGQGSMEINAAHMDESMARGKSPDMSATAIAEAPVKTTAWKSVEEEGESYLV